MRFWNIYWTVLTAIMVFAVAVPDIIAVVLGHREHLGDGLTYTHWLIAHIGLSVIGLFIGYLTAHFLVVHRNG